MNITCSICKPPHATSRHSKFLTCMTDVILVHYSWCTCWQNIQSLNGTTVHIFIQGGVEPTDTFQMVIDNIWKQGKISKTVYKYVQVCYLLPTDYKLIFWKLHHADGLCLHQYIFASMSGSCRTRASIGPHQ